MSTEYGLYCHDCLERLEGVASASIAYGFKVWEPTDKLDAFLEKHVGHYLIVQNDELIDDIVEEALTPPDDLP